MKTSSRLFILAVLAVGLGFSPAVYSQQQQFKIASVDMSKVFAEFYKTKKEEAALKERAALYDKELKERAGELKKMEDEGKKLQEDSENPALAEDKRMEKRRAVEAKLNEYRLLGQQLREMAESRKKELGDQQSRVRGMLVDEITKVIKDKAKLDGYSLVIDKAGLTLSGVPPFIYVQDSLDITVDILKTLNATAPAAGAGASSGATSAATEKSKAKK